MLTAIAVLTALFLLVVLLATVCTAGDQPARKATPGTSAVMAVVLTLLAAGQAFVIFAANQ